MVTSLDPLGSVAICRALFRMGTETVGSGETSMYNRGDICFFGAILKEIFRGTRNQCHTVYNTRNTTHAEGAALHHAAWKISHWKDCLYLSILEYFIVDVCCQDWYSWLVTCPGSHDVGALSLIKMAVSLARNRYSSHATIALSTTHILVLMP